MSYFPEAPLAPPITPAADFEEFKRAYRSSLPAIKTFNYLNHASVGPLSDWVIEAVQLQLLQHQMGESCSQNAWFDGWRLARQRIAELIGATKDEICIQMNTYCGLTRAFNALPVEPGDEVVFPVDEFPSLYYALSEFRARGINVIGAESGRGDGIVRTEDLLNAITPRTKVLATSWVNFFHGYTHDLQALSQACHERGLWFVVDAIQGLGALPIDVKQLGIHFLACNGAKWLCAPLGGGFLYVSREVPPEITPRQEGWFAMELNHEQYTDRSIKPKRNANRFGTGTVALPSVFGLRRACETLLEASPSRASEQALKHADRLERAAEEAGIEVFSDRKKLRSAIVSLKLDRHPQVPEMLKQSRVVFSVREGTLRLSPHWYQTDQEIDEVRDILATAKPA